MKIYQARCTRCGKQNIGLLLDETGGLFECDCCGQINLVRENWIRAYMEETEQVRIPDRTVIRKAGERYASAQ